MRKALLALAFLLFALPASAQITLVGHSIGTGNTMTLPGGIANGDVIIAGVAGDCAQLAQPTFTVIRALKPNCGNVTSLFTYLRVASSEPSSYSISTTSGSTLTTWDVRVYRGVNPNWSIGTLNPTEGGNSGMSCPAKCTITSYGTTTGIPGEVWVSFFAWEDTNGNNLVTAPSGLGNTDNINATGSNPGLFAGDLWQNSVGSIANEQAIITEAPARAFAIAFTLVPAYTNSPTFVGFSDSTGSTCPLPAGILSGDFMIANVVDYNRDPGTSTGWTRLTSGGGNGSPPANNFTSQFILTRVATGSDTAITFSGTPQRQSCIVLAYRHIVGVDTFTTCYTGADCGDPSGLAAPSPSHQDDIVVQLLGAGQGTWTFSTGVAGENTSNGGVMPDIWALIPAYYRDATSQVFNTTWGAAAADYPFYGTLTNTPYLVATGHQADTGVAVALQPASTPTPTPTPSPTPTPTPTPTPSPTPTATPTPSPTPTGSPTPTPLPTPTSGHNCCCCNVRD